MVATLSLRKIILLGGDLILLYISLLLTFLNLEAYFYHFLPFSILYIFWLVVFYIFGLYDFDSTKVRLTLYPKVLGAISVCLVTGIIFFYLTSFFDITPKTNLLLNLLFFGVMLLAWRKIFYLLFSRKFQNKIAVIEETPHLTNEIISRPHLGYKLIKIDLKQDLLSQIQKEKIETMVVPNNLYANDWLAKNLYQCLPARINFIDWARAYETICEKIPVSFIGQTWFLENLKEGQKQVYDKIKRALDIILAGILLVITGPFWFLIAFSIKLGDGGMVFYRQKRIGKNRKPFFLLKFRSMKVNAESRTGPVWAKDEDPRITKVGKWLRRFHLDELPQMINVFRGEISLVGPRPERPEFVEQLEREIPHYHIRHLIQPGFTGWAQIKFRYGRSVMDSQEKFQYDLYYLKNRSPLLDLGILLKTVQLFFKK